MSNLYDAVMELLQVAGPVPEESVREKAADLVSRIDAMAIRERIAKSIREIVKTTD